MSRRSNVVVAPGEVWERVWEGEEDDASIVLTIEPVGVGWRVLWLAGHLAGHLDTLGLPRSIGWKRIV